MVWCQIIFDVEYPYRDHKMVERLRHGQQSQELKPKRKETYLLEEVCALCH
jgi:hypothetical protein